MTQVTRTILLRQRMVVAGKLAVLLFAPLACVDAATPVSADYIGRLGFRDPRHTRSDGFQSSVVLAMNPAGYSVGESQRFFGVPHPQFGALDDLSAWLASPYGGSKSVGLYDAVHTSETGYHTTRVVQMTRSGRVIGHSTRYDGEPIARGQSAWIADWNGGTRRIGWFYDDAPPLPDGTLYNTVLDVNEAGKTIGIAPVYRGQFAWLAENNGATRLIGFYDSAHTRPGAAPNNTPVALNESGTAIGHTNFNTNTQVVWLQGKSGGPPVQIGVYNAAHTLEGGRQHNIGVALNEHGYVIGRALRREPPFEGATASFYSGWLRKPGGSMVVFDAGPAYDSVLTALTNSNLIGGSYSGFGSANAWVYDIAAGTFHTVGLYASEISSYNSLVALTENGVAIGETTYLGMGSSVFWLAAKNGPTFEIGFGEDLGGGGNAISTVEAYSRNGYVVGTSRRNAVNGGGDIAWIASPVTGKSYKIGLVDATHTGASNRQVSVPTQVTSSRFVAGYSERFSPTDEPAGQTAWIYNSPAAAYARFDLSVRATDNYSYSAIHHVTENGIAFGTYTRFGPGGANLGNRAFVWVTKRGVFDLGSVLDVDLATVNWEHLAEAVVGNPAGFIAGHGDPSGPAAQGVFLVRLDNPPAP